MDKTSTNRLIIVGNGFDLAHGLKTSYRDFIDWYFCQVYNHFVKQDKYEDILVKITYKHLHRSVVIINSHPKTLEEVVECFNDGQVSIEYPSTFFKRIVESFQDKNWVDIEIRYYSLLKKLFINSSNSEKVQEVRKLNKQFDYLIKKLAEYIGVVNNLLSQTRPVNLDEYPSCLAKWFSRKNEFSKVFVLNFNYTDTFQTLGYAKNENVVHIHGSVKLIESNPIVFGYGDETDDTYQKIEDSGDNMYLEHIKSFAYFRTNNYQKLLTFMDDIPFDVLILGHSCGLLDRVLLSTIFELKNCKTIDISFHLRKDKSDNFKEITQEISRHFKPQNKGLMRMKVKPINQGNIIPQHKANV